jgi:hypothetical protein
MALVRRLISEARLADLFAAIRSELSEMVRMAQAPAREAQTLADSSRLVKRADDGAAVRHMLESQPVLDFMARTEARLTAELTSLPLSDDAGRRNLAVAIQTQRQLMRYLVAAIEGGISAERELERLRTGPKRAFF